jgi:hypothetical protein
LSAESAGCEALRAEQPVDEIRSALSRERSDLDNGGAGEEQIHAQACLGGDLSVSNRVDRLRFAPHCFFTRAPDRLERSDSLSSYSIVLYISIVLKIYSHPYAAINSLSFFRKLKF